MHTNANEDFKKYFEEVLADEEATAKAKEAIRVLNSKEDKTSVYGQLKEDTEELYWQLVANQIHLHHTDYKYYSDNILIAKLAIENSSAYGSTVVVESSFMTREQLGDFLLTTFKNKAIEKRREAKFNETKKELKMDMFAYNLFERYLNSLKSNLTGKDAIRYLKQVDTSEIGMKFLTLIWNHSTKSKDFVELTISTCRWCKGGPIKVIEGFSSDDKDATERIASEIEGITSKHFYMSIYAYWNVAAELGLPLSLNFKSMQPSTMHKFVTGLDRSVRIKKGQVPVVVDQILILATLINKIQAKKDSPLHVLLKQLKDEISKPVYEEEVLDIKQKYMSTAKVIKGI